MTAGLSAAGFEIKTQAQIIAEIEADLKLTLGPAFTIDSDKAFGASMASLAERFALLWELDEDIYGSQYPDTANDVPLDNVSALVGIERLDAIESTLEGANAAVASGDDGTTIDAGSVASVIGVPTTRFQSLVDVLLTEAVAVGALVRTSAPVIPATLYRATINGQDHDYTSTTLVTAITAVSTAGQWFEVAGDRTDRFQAGESFTVAGSTGNDGTYTVVSATLQGSDTRIVVQEAVPDATADGNISLDDDDIDVARFLAEVLNDSYPIFNVDTGAKKFTLQGNQAPRWVATDTFEVEGSTGNDGDYTVVTSTLVNGDTEVVVSEVVPSAVADGNASNAATVNQPVNGIGFIDGQLQVRSDSLLVTFAITVNANLQIDQVSAAMEMEAEDTGQVQAPAGTLTVIETPVGGWVAITNPGDAVLGRDVETNTALRLRRASSLQIAGAGTLEAIRATVAQETGVLAAFAFENTGDVVDGDGLPPHSFEVVVDGGSDQDIVDTIWLTKPAGIQTFGSSSGVATDSQGDPHTIFFSRPTLIEEFMDVDYERYDEEVFPTDGEAQIAAAVLAFGQALGIGQDILIDRFEATAVLATTGVAETQVKIEDVFPPTNDENIPISKRERAVFDASRIRVIDVTP